MKKIIALAIIAVSMVSASFALELEVGAKVIGGQNVANGSTAIVVLVKGTIVEDATIVTFRSRYNCDFYVNWSWHLFVKGSPSW